MAKREAEALRVTQRESERQRREVAPSVSFRSATGQLATTVGRGTGPQLEEHGEPAAEHRQFPRARMQVRFEAWREAEEGGGRLFSASFLSENVSVSGAFLASTFFLPVGTELRVRFQLNSDEGHVDARAVIVREERSEGRSGFGVRFEEFYGQSEVTLARLFLAHQLQAFASEYLRSPRAHTMESELDRLVDALAAWELLKVTTPRDPWRGK